MLSYDMIMIHDFVRYTLRHGPEKLENPRMTTAILINMH